MDEKIKEEPYTHNTGIRDARNNTSVTTSSLFPLYPHHNHTTTLTTTTTIISMRWYFRHDLSSPHTWLLQPSQKEHV
ncbi:hypothetical protein E2C01_076622 [Portunus trituberculatus]|uniref:Uncharacterized protein n=1 Tax=Portunus trituberculatus TaxID=210409 RepID=A0A5B7IC29_PORTR|nr:hypothetical protein [Portunus trituberculatus]